MNQKYLFAIAAAMMVGVFAIAILFHDKGNATLANTPVVVDRSALERAHAPSLGASDARVHIVEFLDPACETCRSFYPFVKELMAAAPGRIRLSVRYAPLHEGSDEVVRMLEAAKLQGKFWETLEAVFAAQEQWAINHRAHPELVWNFIGNIGLNLEKLRADMRSPAVEAVIRQDIQDGRTVNVQATPEFFVNGRPLPSFGYDPLQALVAEELDKAY